MSSDFLDPDLLDSEILRNSGFRILSSNFLDPDLLDSEILNYGFGILNSEFRISGSRPSGFGNSEF